LLRPAAATLVAAAALLLAREALAAGDPYLEYLTLETPRFRVHYARNLEDVAQRVADTLEQVNRRLAPALGHQPRELTHVFLSDNTESANGSASALPYNAIRLFVTAPDDLSPLNDHDDWVLELTTHEYTHILHTDNIGGVPALVNAVVGKTMAPNQVQPRWLLEGLAVFEESDKTSGGRNRSSIFDMYLRANVLEGKIATIDEFSHTPRRWPGGNIWYLYGSRFLTWIVDTYGEHTMRTIAEDYGRQLVPYGINRSIRRATGRTYEELYEGWTASLRRLYQGQIDRASALAGGLREGTRLTHHGRTTQRPRWVPQAARRDPATPELLYYLDDGHHRSGFHRLFVPSAREAWESDRDLWVRAQGEGSATFDADGNLFFSTIEQHQRIYPFSDISRLPRGVESTGGDEPDRARLTFGQRAADPDVRADGRALTFVINRRGTQYLAVADVLPERTLGPPRVLVPSARYQQAYTPRYSPDGRAIAYSVWSGGGYRDIRLVDARTGSFREIAHDRAMDLQPSWSPDGKTVFFSSDRTGIPNIYAFDVESQALWRVTNVRTGAFMPEVSPDGRTLVYVGYTSDGFDLCGMELDRASWVPAEPYVDRRPDPPAAPPRGDWVRRPYEAFPTLRPYAYNLDYGPGTFGQTLTISASGQDMAGIHGFSLNLATDTSLRSEPQFSFSYGYGRLPFDYTLTAFRSLTPQAQVRINDATPTYPEDYLGIINSIGYTMPRAFDSMSFLASYALSTYRARVPIGPQLDPQSQITTEPPLQGIFAVARFGFSYSSTERYLYSVGPARGTSLQVSMNVSSKETISDYNQYSFSYSLSRYLQMPWAADHTIALSARSGISGGDPSLRGAYYVGGFVNLPLLDSFGPNSYQGGFLLRGYPPNAYAGRQFHLGTIEYRLPLLHPERGLGTLPIFFNRVSGAAFLDYGGAFNDLDVDHWRTQLHTGLGAELFLDATVGFFISTTARLGYARGLSPEAYPGGKIYFVLGSAY
jgi:hypothetical protein